MEKASVRIYYGSGAGKSSAALGYAVRAASEGRTVYIIQFMKAEMNYDYMKKLEPEVKFFRFERTKERFNDLPEDRKSEEVQNMRNGIMYAKKVLSTGECDLLVLDEVLGLVQEGIIAEEDLAEILSQRSVNTDIILTGTNLSPLVSAQADFVYRISEEKGV